MQDMRCGVASAPPTLPTISGTIVALHAALDTLERQVWWQPRDEVEKQNSATDIINWTKATMEQLTAAIERIEKMSAVLRDATSVMR